MRHSKLLAATSALALLGAAAPSWAQAPAQAADPLAELKQGCAAKRSADQPPARSVSYRMCSGKVASFDGTLLDASLTLPARVRRGRRLPLVVFLHGFLSQKGEYLSETSAGTGPDRGADAYKTALWNNVWFASRGYAVLNYSSRGHGDSAGEIGLASKNVEVRDTHHLTGLLVDDGVTARPLVRVNQRRVGVTGGSYGGGQAWLLLATRGQGAREFGTWRSPGGRLVKLGAVVPMYTWTDLLYSLAPSGHHLSEGVDPAGAATPFGVGKNTLVNGFLGSANQKLTPEVLRYLARFNAGEPYDDPSDPVVPEAKRALTTDRSAFYQDDFFAALKARRTRRVPVLAAQGWTDPIFAAIEPLRMYRRLREASRGYPIGLYFGDFEHLSSLAKVPDLKRYHVLGTRMFDHHLRGRRPRLRFDARTAVTNCRPASFGPVLRAADYDSLARDRLTYELGGPQQTASPLNDPRGPAADGVVVATQRGRGCLTTNLPPTPGVATYFIPVERDFTMVGLPRLSLRFRTVAPDIELNSRLWDVAPDGTQTLVDRGAYRSVGTDPAARNVTYELFGNAYRFAAGHRIMLEVTQDDSTYLRRDNFSSSATIDQARLELPTR